MVSQTQADTKRVYSLDIQKQKEKDSLIHLLRRYPEEGMQYLALMGAERFCRMYYEQTGIMLGRYDIDADPGVPE